MYKCKHSPSAYTANTRSDSGSERGPGTGNERASHIYPQKHALRLGRAEKTMNNRVVYVNPVRVKSRINNCEENRACFLKTRPEEPQAGKERTAVVTAAMVLLGRCDPAAGSKWSVVVVGLVA